MARETTDISNQELDELFERYRQAPSSYVFVVLADTLRKMGRIEEALDVCDQGMGTHPDYASGHVVRGKCLYDLERHEEALDAFHEVLRLDQNNLVALKFLGMIEAEQGRLESARARFERILVLDPSNEEIKKALRVVDEKGRDEGETGDVEELDIESAVVEEAQPVRRAPELETSEELASVTLADIFASQGYTEKALAIYREVLAQQPHNAAVRAKIEALTGETLEPEPPPAPVETAEPAIEAQQTQAQDEEEPADMGGDDAADVEPGVIELGEGPQDSQEDDDRMVGETIELSDGSSAELDGAERQEPASAGLQPSWEPEIVSPAVPVRNDDGDLDAEVDRVIMLGTDADVEPTVEPAPTTESPQEAGAADGEEDEKPAVVELPYDAGDQAGEAEERQFEEIDESRPIKRQSPPASRKGVRTRSEDTTAQRHRRSIDEKENFNYFKRWLNRMQD